MGKKKNTSVAKRIYLTDSEFLTILRENAGLFARTATAIQKQFKITYSRQAVFDRAQNHLAELADIREQNIDVAEEGLFSLMRTGPPTVKIKAIELFLKTQGRNRGYVTKTEIDVTAKQEYDLSNLSDDELIIWIELRQKLIKGDSQQKSIE